MTDADRPRATSVPADLDPGDPPPGHPVVAFRSPRRSLWGHGEALRIDVAAPWPDHVGVVADTLAELCGSDDVSTPGTGPVAFAALPFDPASAAQFVVPAVVHGHTAEGTRWITTVGTSDDATGLPHPEPLPARSPAAITVASTVPDEQWCAAVALATERIRAGRLTKVVLARSLQIDANEPIDAASLLSRLRRQYPAAMTFAVDGFVGASPELLVSRVGDVVRAQPMAGTTPRTGEPEADQRRAGELLSSEKNRREHQITIDMVHDTLLPWCSFLDAEPSPSVVPAGPVQHLASIVEGRLSHPTPSVLDLVAALHPTPAVGGWPRAEALALIDELEHVDRGRYAGPVGWVDAAGNGAWAVGIRSVQLDGRSARLFAGVGVVEDSDPLAELEETRSKAQALLGSIVRL